MKLLLDENLSTKLKKQFSDIHQIFTVAEQGWNGKKNGELLKLLLSNKFDALVTIDKNLKYQQNIDKYGIIVIILNAKNNKLETLKPFALDIDKLKLENIKNSIIELNAS